MQKLPTGYLSQVVLHVWISSRMVNTVCFYRFPNFHVILIHVFTDVLEFPKRDVCKAETHPQTERQRANSGARDCKLPTEREIPIEDKPSGCAI